MLKKIAFVVGGIIAGLLIFAATRPDTFSIQRSITIHTSADPIFILLNDYRNGDKWSPWEKLDPQMRRSYSTPSNGKGAFYSWQGNAEVGSGRSTIIESVFPSKIVMQLHMIQPFEAINRVEFNLKPIGQSTQVTWTMSGPQPYFAKVIGIIMNCDKIVGSQFEEGLQLLKISVEKSYKKD